KLKDISVIEKNIVIIEENCKKLNSVVALKNKIDKVNKSLSIGKVYIEKLSIIEPLFNLKNSIEEKYKLLENLLTIKTKYEHINNAYTDTHKKLTKIQNNIKNLLRQYEDILNNLEVCPVCYSSIDKNSIKNIINSLNS